MVFLKKKLVMGCNQLIFSLKYFKGQVFKATSPPPQPWGNTKISEQVVLLAKEKST